MAFIPTPETVKCVCRFVGDGTPFSVQLFFRKLALGGITPADLQAVAEQVADLIEAFLMPHLSGDCDFTGTTVTDVSVANGQQYVENRSQAGGASGGMAPLNVAFVIKHQTGFTGRSFRGRSYVGGLSKLGINNNSMASTVADNIEGAFDAIRSDITLVGFEFVIVSFIANGVPRLNGLATTVTNSVYTDLQVDTRRKRLPI